MAVEVAPKERLPIWSGKNIEAYRRRHWSADIGGRGVVAAKMSSLGRTHQRHDGRAKRCSIHTRTNHPHDFPLILQRSVCTIAALSRGPQAMSCIRPCSLAKLKGKIVTPPIVPGGYLPEFSWSMGEVKRLPG